MPGFFLVLFFVRYYDFFYLYLPVRIFVPGGVYEPTLLSFTLYNYLLKALFYLFKFLVVAAALSAGIFLEGNKNKEKITSIGSLFVLAAAGEFSFVLADLVKIIDLSFFSVGYTDQDHLHYYPLSLFSLSGADPDSPFSNLLQSISVFELMYIFILGYGLKELQYPDGNKAYKIAAISYGCLLLFWIVVTTSIKLI